MPACPGPGAGFCAGVVRGVVRLVRATGPAAACAGALPLPAGVDSAGAGVGDVDAHASARMCGGREESGLAAEAEAETGGYGCSSLIGVAGLCASRVDVDDDGLLGGADAAAEVDGVFGSRPRTRGGGAAGFYRIWAVYGVLRRA